jgi:hypothetical protein
MIFAFSYFDMEYLPFLDGLTAIFKWFEHHFQMVWARRQKYLIFENWLLEVTFENVLIFENIVLIFFYS